MTRSWAVLTALLTIAGLAPIATAGTRQPALPIVAVIDSGLRPTHVEFDYRGPRSAADQIVAWWDFTATKGAARSPRTGQVWDDRTPSPYDDNGHGTAVASMAVGRNRSSEKSPSAAPGYRLAVARVINAGNGVDGDLGAAVRWATRTVKADVITISINLVAPVPRAAGVVEGIFAALDEARQAGITVVVSNGNGWANVGVVPGQPGWATGLGNSPSVLSVGAAAEQGLLFTTDPEIVADHVPIAAGIRADSHYEGVGGTSFATPFVAGLAARIIERARLFGKPSDPARVEELLKLSATDTEIPPTFEGYGELTLRQLPGVLRHAERGTLPGRPSPDPTGIYMREVQARLSGAFTRPAN